MIDKIKKIAPKDSLIELDKLNEFAIKKIYNEVIELEVGSENSVSIKSLKVEGIFVRVAFNPIKDYYPPQGKKKDYNSYSLVFDM